MPSRLSKNFASRTGFASALAVATFAGCQKKNEFVKPPPPVVTVAQPVQRDVVHQMEFTGTTRATEAVEVRARVNGYLEKIAFEDGAQVKAGDLLFAIEAAPYEAALDAAKASLQKAEASLALATADLGRTEPLVQRGTLSQQELDLKIANVATARAEVAAANAEIRQADLNLAYTQVKSPISGRVSRHLVDVGNLVQTGTTVLTRVESFNPIHAYFAVSESDVLEFIRLKMESGVASSAANAPKLYLGLTEANGFPYEGRLDFAEIGVDPETGTQLRRGEFPNPDGQLVPGLFVRLKLPIGEPSPGIMVPDRAIATDQRGQYVLAVNEENVVEYRPVQLGTRVADMRVVNEGVKLEDWIVVNGIQRARPGTPVDPQEEKIAAEGQVEVATGESPKSATSAVPESTAVAKSDQGK